jgi:hypothetical protein
MDTATVELIELFVDFLVSMEKEFLFMKCLTREKLNNEYPQEERRNVATGMSFLIDFLVINGISSRHS